MFRDSGRAGGAPQNTLVTISDQCPESAFGTWHNLLINVVVASETPECMEMFEDCGVRLIRQHQRGIGVLLVVTHGQKPPAGYADHMGRMLRGYRENILAVGAVLEAEGFAAAAQRSVGTGIAQLVGASDSIRIVQQLSDLTTWLTDRISIGAPAADNPIALSTAVSAFRRQVLSERGR